EQRHVVLAARRGEARELPVFVAAALALPLVKALLDEPQPHDVCEQAGRAVDAALVTEVVCARQIRQDRLLELDPEQRPRARRQNRRPWATNRGGGKRRGGVVPRRQMYVDSG